MVIMASFHTHYNLSIYLLPTFVVTYLAMSALSKEVSALKPPSAPLSCLCAPVESFAQATSNPTLRLLVIKSKADSIVVGQTIQDKCLKICKLIMNNAMKLKDKPCKFIL